MNQSHVLHIKDVANLLKVHPGTVYRLISDGRGPPFVRIGTLIRFPRQDFEAWMKNGGTPAKVAGSRGIGGKRKRKMRKS